MADASSHFLATQRIAVVTGANKGIGLEICRQLASKGVLVILTARDAKKGAQAIEILKEFGLSNDQIIFHQVDVTNHSSITHLKDFIEAKFGKLDILVNNAGVLGVLLDKDATKTTKPEEFIEKLNAATQTYDEAEECIKTNYYGAKLMLQEFSHLLQLSDSPRIVNVSSIAGKLEYVRNEWAIGVLDDSENVTEEKVDMVLNEFLKDIKVDSLESKKWPLLLPAYRLSKAAMNAYTRILAKKFPNFLVNCVCPGFAKTDLTCNNGDLSAQEGAESPVWLALLPHGGPSGKFFVRKTMSPF